MKNFAIFIVTFCLFCVLLSSHAGQEFAFSGLFAAKEGRTEKGKKATSRIARDGQGPSRVEGQGIRRIAGEGKDSYNDIQKEFTKFEKLASMQEDKITKLIGQTEEMMDEMKEMNRFHKQRHELGQIRIDRLTNMLDEMKKEYEEKTKKMRKLIYENIKTEADSMGGKLTTDQLTALTETIEQAFEATKNKIKKKKHK